MNERVRDRFWLNLRFSLWDFLKSICLIILPFFLLTFFFFFLLKSFLGLNLALCLPGRPLPFDPCPLPFYYAFIIFWCFCLGPAWSEICLICVPMQAVPSCLVYWLRWDFANLLLPAFEQDPPDLRL